MGSAGLKNEKRKGRSQQNAALPAAATRVRAASRRKRKKKIEALAVQRAAQRAGQLECAGAQPTLRARSPVERGPARETTAGARTRTTASENRVLELSCVMSSPMMPPVFC